jgi:hypothetical protein
MTLTTAIFFQNNLEKMIEKFGFSKQAGNHRYVREKRHDVSK